LTFFSKVSSLTFALLLGKSLTACSTLESGTPGGEHAQLNSAMTFYDLQAPDLQGQTIFFSQFRGKKVLVVNTASECGFTSQLAKLQQLQDSYRDRLVVVGIPTNDFAGQEPLNNSEIGAFCSRNYGVNFLILAKGTARGSSIHPVLEWLTTRRLNGVSSSKVWWNFQKYLVDENGRLVTWYLPTTSPMASRVVRQIEGR
jgi:glutathione peroxidase